MKRKGMWFVVSVLVVLGLLMGGFGCKAPAPKPTPTPTPVPTPVKPIVLKVASTSGAGYIMNILLERAMDMIKQRSGGRIDFEYHKYGSLYNLTQSSQALMTNTIQLGDFKGGYFPDKLGIIGEVANLPYNYPDKGFIARVRDKGGFFDWVTPYYEKVGVKLLVYGVVPSLGIITKKPVRKLEDLKGMLMRAIPGAAAEGWKLLGAEPVFLTVGEIYEGLLRGTVDGTSGSVSTSLSLKYYEAAKYWTLCDITTAGIEHVMSLPAWNSLSADLQKIIVDAFKEAEQMHFKEFEATYAKELEQLKGKGVEIISLDTKELDRWRAKVAPLYDTYAKKYGAEWEQFSKIRQTMLK